MIGGNKYVSQAYVEARFGVSNVLKLGLKWKAPQAPCVEHHDRNYKKK